jgi:hypothetical protein
MRALWSTTARLFRRKRCNDRTSPKRLEELAGLPHSIGRAKCSPMSQRIMQTRSTRIRFERSEGSDAVGVSTDIAQALGIKAAQ